MILKQTEKFKNQYFNKFISKEKNRGDHAC